MTKFSTSGFVHPVFIVYRIAQKRHAQRERNNRASVRERVRTNGRTENERKEKHSKARACVGEKKDFKNFQNATQRVCTHLLKERARKGSRPKRQSEQKRRRNKRVPGEGVKFHKLRASPTFGPCSAIFFFSQETTTRGFVWMRMRKKTSASDLFRVLFSLGFRV